MTLTTFTLFISFFPFLSLAQSKSTFIVHVSKPHYLTTTSTSNSHHHYYTSILNSLSSSSTSSNEPDLIYSYTHSATAFAAHLTAAQAVKLSRHPEVLSVIPDRTHQLQTTRTPEFMGLGRGSGLWPNANYGTDMVIGVIDSGIWPSIASFDDSGYGPVPATWKGSCDVGPSFPAGSCNRKIIGARAFYKGAEKSYGPINETKDSKSPLDTEGHGTHCASTAAGSLVPNANIFGYGQGEARGTAYKARIAVYKVCWSTGCKESDILAAMDQAILDGVNVMSLSVGGAPPAKDYVEDSVSIGAFHATQRGVIVSVAAGNFGSRDFTAVNVAPWILTVGASTIDREFRADVVLGNGRRFNGASLYYGKGFNDSVSWGLVYGKDVGSKLCEKGKLDASKVSGKMVICERGPKRVAKGYAVKQAGGVGMILVNPVEYGEELLSDPHLIPATMVSYIAGNQIKDYASSKSNPTATIDFRGTMVGSTPSSPRVAAFSGRGPNKVTPEILKPDIVAPGVNILAGWTGFASSSDMAVDHREVQFNVISGTSMACPHVSGLAALLRNVHRSWSASAIKSALMTTSYNLDHAGKNLTELATSKPSTPFSHGSGHVDPNKALDPGLVYDNNANDYIAFLCAIGYNQKQIKMFLNDPAVIDCGIRKLSRPGDLNYPSFSIVFDPDHNVVKYTRRVTNVGPSVSAVYVVTVNAPSNVRITVNPVKLVFSARKPSLSYEISFISSGVTGQSINGSSSFGSIEWGDGSHRVRSPIAVRWVPRTPKKLVASN